MCPTSVGVAHPGVGGGPHDIGGKVLLSLALILGGLVVAAALFFWLTNPFPGELIVETPAEITAPSAAEANQQVDAFHSQPNHEREPSARRNRQQNPDRGDPGVVDDTRSPGAGTESRGPENAELGGGGEASAASIQATDPKPETPPAEEEPKDTEDEEPRSRNLSGWVFDEAGTGVPELVVVAEARRLAPEAVEAATGGARSAMARTDGEGFFDLPGLIDGEYAVRTESTDRYESASGMYRAGVDSAVLVVPEKTSQRATVRGFVESADGGSLQGVQAIPVSQFESRVSTDSEGAYLLTLALDPRRRAQTLRFILDGFREHRLTVDDAELRAGNEVIRNVLLEPLREKTTVTGSVVGSDGSPVHRAHIQLYSANLARRADGVSDRDGMFSIPDVEHGDDYRLWVRPPSGYKDYLEENLVITGWVDLDIVVDDIEWSSLEGQMIDPDGRPVPGFTLWLRTASEGAQRVTPVTGDDLGRFFIDQLPEGSAALQTQASPFLTFSGIELAPGAVNNVRLRLDTGSHRLGGFILGAGGGPVAGARIPLLWSVVENGVRSRSKRETFSDANGYFLFTNLGSGQHTLTVSAHGFRSARLQLDTRENNEEFLIHLVEDSP